MSHSLEALLKRIQAILHQATVAGTAHAPHALQEAAGYGPALDEVGFGALADQLARLAGEIAHTSYQDTRQQARALADALRAVELALTYLTRPEGTPSLDGVAWHDGSVLVEPVTDPAEAIYGASDLQWAWVLWNHRQWLAQERDWLLGLAAEASNQVRRRAIEALSYVPVPAVVDELVRQLGDERVGRAVVNALVRIGTDGRAEVVPALTGILSADTLDRRTGSAALILYRLGAYRELAGYHAHPYLIVRSYAELAVSDDADPPSPLLDDAVAGNILLAASDDRRGTANEDLTEALFALQKRVLKELCFYLADTPSGERLLAHARRAMTGPARRAGRQKACLVLGALGDARDVPRLIGLSNGGLSDAYEALGMLGGEAVYHHLSEVAEGRQSRRNVGAAIQALGTLGDKRAVPTLISFLDNRLYDRSAAAALGAIGAREAVQPIVARLSKAQPFEVSTYVDALIKIGDPAAVPGLVQLLSQFPGRITASRRVLARGLIHFADHSIDAAIGLLRHPDAQVRAIAEEVLTSIQTTRSAEALDAYLDRDPTQRLLTQLAHGSTEVRRRAEQSLSEMSGPELAQLLEEVLGEGEGKATSKEQRALLKAVEGLQFPEVIPPLRAMVGNQRKSLAQSAASALASFPYVISRPTLMAHLEGQKIGEVRRIAQMLGQQDTSVVSEVLGHLYSDSPSVRAGALTVLGAKRARWAIDAVMPLFDDPHADVRQALVSNIVSLSAPRWEEEITSRLTAMLDSASRGLLPLLVTALHTMACGSDREDVHLGLVSAWKRQNQQANRTLEAIGAVGHPDARTLLLSQLDSSNRTVVQSAVTGLSRLGDPAAIPPLEASFERATATSLFRVLHEALSRLAKGWHRLYYAQNAMARGNSRAALAAMHDYVADNPDDGEAYLERGRALHWNGELVAAHDDYLLAVQHLHRPELALHGAALAAHQMGDLDSALAHFDQAMQKHRGFGEVRLRRGLLHLERLDYAAALADFLAAATSGSVISSLHQRIASVLVDVVKLFVDAPPGQPPTRVELLSLMDRPLPNRLADLVLIWALILTRRFNEARQCLDRFARRWPEARAYTLLNTAWLYAAAGDMAHAQEALDDLEVYAVGQGYHWPTYLLHAFAEWPVVREPLTAMMFQAAGREP